MNPTTIVQHGSLAINLARIKNIRIHPISDHHYELVFEFTGRAEYSQHPATLVWEKEIIYEETRISYESFEMADAYLRDWVESWKDFNLLP